MKKRILSAVLGVAIAFSAFSPVMAAENTKIKNIIYMIPDGGGMVPFYLADELKQAGGWNRDVFPNSAVTEKEEMYSKKYLVGSITTHSANADITDSAAAGTALSSGYKTKNSYVGVDPDKIPHANILEAAQYVGKKTGMVSTYEWTNATPASFSAHYPDRGNYVSMSEQIVNQGIDVVLGGGFGAAKWGDISEAEIRGYDIIDTKEELSNVKPGDKIWGNLVSGAFPYDIEKSEELPDIAEMTKAAITALDDGDENGFFLMVEGSKVDGGGHSNYAKGMAGEFLAFDEACKVALQYAEKRSDTIVVIAPDHDTGGMIVPEDVTKVVETLKNGNEPEEVTWETTNHTARHGGLFMYVPEGVAYPDGISGKDMGTNKAYDENLIDNTAIAQYLADIMGVKLDELTKNLFVDVTDMGTYDSELEVFMFTDYPVNVRSNVSYAYVGSDIVELDGQVTALINGKFYVPALLLDIAEGKVEYKKNEFASSIVSSMNSYLPDTSNITKWNGRVKVTNLLPDKEFKGKLRFTYPESFNSIGEFDLNLGCESSEIIEFECPEFDTLDTTLDFKYEITADDGYVYSFNSKFKGLAYAGRADEEIKVDGIIDEQAWQDGVVMTCDDASKIEMIEDWKGERDLSADFSILWDDKYFYMYAKVTDEIFAPYNEVSGLWNGDSIQIGLFNDTEGIMASGNAGKKFEEIGIAYIDNKPVAYRYISQKGLTETGEIPVGDGFELACVRVGDDMIYELKAEWSKLFGYDYTPQIGEVLGFSALINDNDGGGRRGWMEYGSGIGKSKDVNEFVMMPLINLKQKNEQNNEIELYVNGEKIQSDVAPAVREDVLLMPVRAVFEALGAEVKWIDDTWTVVSKLDENVVEMKIGDKSISVNGEIKETEAPVQLENGRTLAPAGAFSDSYGCDVKWDAASKLVTVISR